MSTLLAWHGFGYVNGVGDTYQSAFKKVTSMDAMPSPRTRPVAETIIAALWFCGLPRSHSASMIVPITRGIVKLGVMNIPIAKPMPLGRQDSSAVDMRLNGCWAGSESDVYTTTSGRMARTRPNTAPASE